MARKDDQDKIRMELIQPVLFEEVGKVLTFGAKKYEAFNWMKGNGLDSMRIYGSIQRHLNSWRDGEDNDKESGLLHLSHAACELMFLLQFQVKGGSTDTRPIFNDKKPDLVIDKKSGVFPLPMANDEGSITIKKPDIFRPIPHELISSTLDNKENIPP
jgi:Domain of unknown function (DUF5664)